MTSLDTLSPRLASLHATAVSAATGLPGPIVVAGMGGSGTRVVAQVMKEVGCYIGGALNPANDNMLFAALLNHPQWFKSATNEQLTQTLRLFDRAMHNDLAWSDIPAILRVMRAVLRIEPRAFRPDQRRMTIRSRMTEPFRRLGKLPGLIEPVGLTPYRAWGWKNPGSLFHMPLLVDFFPELKFVLVIRHGLDMAYSSLQGQPVYWSWLYQLPPVSYPVPPAHMLAFWVRANQAAIAIGEERLGNRFLVLNFDRLCASPEAEIDRLISLFDLPISEETRESLIKLPRVPGSMGRYKKQDRSTLAPEDVEAVRQMGFDIEG